MQYHEFGTSRGEVVLLLHGGGLSWWSYREAAERLQQSCRVILPILDGHGGSDRPFTTIENNASGLIGFIDEHFGGSVGLLGGLSLGAQVALEMLSQRGGVCRCALIESAAVIPSKLTSALIGPAFGSSYGLIRNRSFARLQFRSLRMKPALFEEYYRDTCRIAKSDMIAFMKATAEYALKESLRGCSARVHVFAGARENRRVLASAEAIRRALPGSTLNILPGLYHGEFSMNHAREFADRAASILEQGNTGGERC